MFDPKQLLPIIKSSFPKATDEQLLAALDKLAKGHPQLSAMQALAALQKFMQEKQNPSIGMMARRGSLQ
jgi:hypothetical protein